MNILPASIAPYAKTWVSLILSALTAVSAIVDLPQWVTIAAAVLTVVGTYLTPNGDKPGEATVKVAPAPKL